MGRARIPPGRNVLDSCARNYTCHTPASPGGAAWSEKAEASSAPGTPAGAGIWEEKLVAAAVGGEARGVAGAPHYRSSPGHALTSQESTWGTGQRLGIPPARPFSLSGHRLAGCACSARLEGGAARIVRCRDRTRPGVRISAPSCTLNLPGTPAIPAPLGPPLDAAVHLLCAAQGSGSRCSPQSSCLPSYSAPNPIPAPRDSGLLS